MSDNWQVFDINDLKQRHAKNGSSAPSFHEFLNVDSMHCGIYRLPKGSKDMQSPHDEDEMYYVLEGTAKLRVGGEEKVVTPGMLLYIKASEEHAFFEIEQDMTLLVMFA